MIKHNYIHVCFTIPKYIFVVKKDKYLYSSLNDVMDADKH